MKMLIHKVLLYILPVAMLTTTAVTPAKNANTDPIDENEEIAASVNGSPITITELTPQVEATLNRYKKYGMQRLNGELMRTFRIQALNKLIDNELLYQEAVKIKPDDLDKRIDTKLGELKNDAKSENSDLDEQKVRTLLAKRILIDDYLTRQNLKEPQLPEAEIKDYYEKNKASFKHDETVRTRHILVSLAADAPSEENRAALKKVEEARDKILAGEPFAEVAKSYSDCNSASNGGELGYQPRGYMPPEFDDVAFSLEIGKLSNVIKTKFGFHVLEVIDHKAPGNPTYDEIRDFIATYLNRQHQRQVMDNLLKDLRKKAKIDIYL